MQTIHIDISIFNICGLASKLKISKQFAISDTMYLG